MNFIVLFLHNFYFDFTKKYFFFKLKYFLPETKTLNKIVKSTFYKNC